MKKMLGRIVGVFVGMMLVVSAAKAGNPNITAAGGVTTFCQGGNVKLTATGVDTGYIVQWKLNNVIISGAIDTFYTATLSGNYIIEAIKGGTTLTSNSISVTVNPNATINLSGNNSQQICAGSSISTIQYSIGGGGSGATVSGLPAGINGSFNNGKFSIGGNSSVSGTYNYTINTTGTCNQTNATGTIVVNELPNLLLEDKLNPFNQFNNCGNTTSNPKFDISLVNKTSNASNILSYKIVWGDGTSDIFPTNSSFPIQHTYNSFGLFPLTISATNSNGCFSSKSYNVINQTNPAIGIQGPPLGSTQGCAPIGFWFKCTNYSKNTSGTTYEWDFNDGTNRVIWTTPLIVDSIFHTFTTSSCLKPDSQFIVSLKAINSCKTTPVTIGSINIYKRPVASFTSNTLNACVGATVSFTNNTTPAFNSPNCNNTTIYEWDFGDPLSGANNNSSNFNESHIYTKAGTYTVSLIATGRCGPDTMTKTICVNSIPPNPTFTVNTTSGCAPFVVNLSNTTSAANCGTNGINWLINQQSSNCSKDSTVDYVYLNSSSAGSNSASIRFNNQGSYLVKLSIDGCGGKQTSTIIQTIDVKRKPEVGSIVLDSNLCASTTVNPTVTVKTCGGSGISYNWSFPGATPTSSNATSPSVTYSNLGSNTITLSVSNAECGSTTVTKQINTLLSPNVNSIPNITVCNGANVSIPNFSSSLNGALFNWTNSNLSIGLSASGSNNIASFSAINNGSSIQTATITVTPLNPTNGCNGVSTSFTITVNPSPNPPAVSSQGPYCQNVIASALTATADAGNTLNWFNVATGGTALSTAPIPNTATVGSINYYVSQTNSVTKCEGQRARIQVLIRTSPVIINVSQSNPSQCNTADGSFTLQGLTPNRIFSGTYILGGISKAFSGRSDNAGNLIVGSLASGTYSNINVIQNGCSSNNAGPITLSDPSAPSVPVASAVKNTLCSGENLQLNATGNAGATFVWSGPNSYNNSSTNAAVTINSVSTNASGTYSVLCILNGCKSGASTVNVTVNETPATPSVTYNSPLCSGNTLNLTATTTTSGTITYSWTGPVTILTTTATPSIPNAQSANNGTYKATATQNGCSSTAGNVTVVVNPTPSAITVSKTDPSICATANGSITVGGLTSGISYVITYTNPSGTVITLPSTTASSSNEITIPNLKSGAYSNLSATSAAGCNSNTITSISLNDPTPPAKPTITTTPTNAIICSGNNFSFQASSTTAGATFNWNGPNGFTSSLANPTINNIQLADAGTFIVTATLNGCTSASTVVVVTVNETPATPSVTYNSPLCSGNTLNLTATTTTSGTITYSWTGPVTILTTTATPSIPNAQSANNGTYKATATQNGCSSTAGNVTVVVNPTPSAITVSKTDPSICATANGSITVGGLTSGVSYVISYTNPSGTVVAFPSTTATSSGEITIPNLKSGAYSNLSATSAAGCSSNTIATISLNDPNPPAKPTVTTTPTNAIICSGNNFSFQASSTTAGATFNWNGPNGFTSPLANPIINNIQLADAGTFTVTATLNGCTSASTVVVVTANETPATPTVTYNSPLCSGNTLNLIAVTTTSGTNTYSWTGPVTILTTTATPSIPNAQSANNGTYKATATQNGCSSTAGNVTVVVNPTPSAITVSKTDPSICATANGSITVGGLTSGVSYVISYTNPSGTVVAFPSTTATSSGEITIPNLFSGAYTNLSATSAAGCNSNTITSISLNDPTPPAKPTITTTPTNAIICSGNNFSFQASSTTAGATFNWNGPNGFTSPLANPIINNIQLADAGTFTVTATLKGCTSASTSVVVTVNETPTTPTVTYNSPLCSGNTLNLNAVTTTSGTNTYSWTGPVTILTTTSTPSIPNAQSANNGTYKATATQNGCSSTAGNVTVVVNPTPSAITVSKTDPSICATANGSITVGGLTSGVSYIITYTDPSGTVITLPSTTASSSNEITIPNLKSGAYTNLSATSVAGCSSNTIASISLNDPTPPVKPTITTNPTNATICSGNNFSFQASSTTSGATFNWNGPNGFTSLLANPTINNIQLADAGTFTVTATINGCTSASTLVSVIVNETPATPTISYNTPICSGNSLILTANTTTIGAIVYSWTGPSYTSSGSSPTIANAQVSNSGNYTVIATLDVCKSLVGSQVVKVNITPSISATKVDPNQCAAANGSILLSTVESLTNYTIKYTDVNGLQTASLLSSNSGVITLQNLKAGAYTNITVTSDSGCISNSITSISLVDPNPPATPTISPINPICTGQTLSLQASCTTSGVTFNWTGPSFTSAIANPQITNIALSATGTYSVTATLNNCISPAANVSVTVNETPSIPIVGYSTPLCSGSTLNLSATSTTPGGITYVWTSNSIIPFSSNIQNPQILNVQTNSTGTYSVTATLGICTSNAGTKLVIVNETPSISAVKTDPTTCASATGTIKISGLPKAVAIYTVGYNDGTPQSISIQSDIAGNITILGLKAGNYSNISVTTDSNCVSNIAGPLNLIDPSPPATPTASVLPNHVCSGSMINFTSATTTVGSGLDTISYVWSGVHAYTVQNPVINSTNTADSGFYTVVAILKGCISAPTTVHLAVDSTPAKPIIDNIPSLCSGNNLTLHAQTPTSGSFNYVWTGPNFNYNKPDTTLKNVTDLQGGMYYVQAIAPQGLFCKSAIDSVFVIIRKALTQAKISQKALTICNFSPPANNSATLTGNLDATRTYEYGRWRIISKPSGSLPIISDTTLPSATITFDSSGIYKLVWAIGNDVGCKETTDTMQITIVDKPAINGLIKTKDTIVCAGNPITLTIDPNLIKGKINKWQYMLPYKSGIWKDTLTRNPSLTFANLTDTFYVRLVVMATDSVICNKDTAFKQQLIYVAPPSSSGVASGIDTVCQGNNSGIITLLGNIGTPTWQLSTDSINFTNIIGSGGQSFSYSNIVTNTWYRSAVKSGVCDTVFSNAIKVTVFLPVTQATVGANAELCADSIYSLTANAPINNEIGTWSFASGSATALIDSIHKPNTNVRGLLANTNYKLVWTLDNGICAPTTATLTIINYGPLINNIDTQRTTVCNQVPVTVNGSPASGGNFPYVYQWQILQGTNWVDIPNETNPSYSFIGDTTVILRRKVTAIPCTSYSLERIVFVQPPLSNNFITGKTESCINISPGLLTGSLPLGADGNFIYQWQTSKDTIAIPWADIAGATSKDYTPPVLNTTDTFYYRRKVSTLLCVGNQANYSAGFKIIVRPDASAAWQIIKDTSCTPFNIDNAALFPLLDTSKNNSYSWYAHDSLYGNSINSNPGFVLVGAGDSVSIKMVAISRYGCKNDSLQHWFFTPPRPDTRFKLSDSSGCGPLAVTITNTTPLQGGFRYQYFWDFGIGQTSTLSNPGVVVFPSSPSNKDTIYVVKLTAYTACDTVTVSKNIKVRSKAKAIFTPSKTFGCSPLTDTFINTSRGDSTTYLWQFGDNTSLSVLDSLPVSHTYNTGAQDTFNVKLIAKNYCGNDTAQYAIVVAKSTIDLRIIVNGNELTNCRNSVVHFINTTKGASTFNWDFGDGNQATTFNNVGGLDTIVHRYDTTGTFKVSIRATNNCTDTTGGLIIKVLSTPTAAFVATPDTVCIGHPISFKNYSNATTSLVWAFGDGTGSLLTNPNHAYKTAGNFNVQLIAARQHPSANICRDTAIRQVTIIPSLPGSMKASDSISVCVPFTVSFTNIFAASTKLCSWNFGDGSTGTGNTITHTFTTVGTYQVVMNAMDTGGCTYTANKQIVVNGPAGFFVYDHGIICGKIPVRLEATVTGTDSLKWDFGNGETLITNDRIVYHTYPQSGKFVPNVTLLSGIRGSCKVLLKGIDTITIDHVKAGFATTDLKVCDLTTVNFIDTSRAFLGLKNWAWQFGDGTTSTLQNPKHRYLTTNTWAVQLIVQSKSGCSDTADLPTLIKVNNTPQASILANNTGCATQAVVYDAIVTSIDPATYFNWTFSNGTSGNTPTINAYYALAGTYTAKLIVGTAFGCYDTAAIASIKINPTPIVTTNPDFKICKGQSAFINTVGAPTYQWTPSTGLSCNTCPNPIANPITTTEYVVAGYNSLGCAGRDTMLVTVIQPFQLVTSGNDTMCIGDNAHQLTVSGASNYRWFPPTGLSAVNIPTPLANPTITTKYRVIGTDNFSCFADTAYLVVAVGTYPKLRLGGDLVLATGTQLPLNPILTYSTSTGGPIGNYAWSPKADLSCENCPNPIATIKHDVCYSLVATNIYGCSSNADTMCIRSFCENSQLFVPNAFTPDNDGVNDKLVVRGKGIRVIKSFRIFNRWGQVVFEKANFQPNDDTYGWDGTIKGVPATADVYVYTCEVVCENDVPFVFKGNIAILK